MPDPQDQIDAVRLAGFEKVRLPNREEARLLPVLDALVRDVAQGHRVMAQTCLGEVIRPTTPATDPDPGRRAFAAINARRPDFAIFDRAGLPVCAIEYQGSGHDHAGTVLRDAVTREALRMAGVQMIEVRPDFDPDRLCAELRPMRRSPQPAARG